MLLTWFQSIIQERDEERDRMRRELERFQDQMHAFLISSSSSSNTTTTNTNTIVNSSRPVSLVSDDLGSGPLSNTTETSEGNSEEKEEAPGEISQDRGQEENQQGNYLRRRALLILRFLKTNF